MNMIKHFVSFNNGKPHYLHLKDNNVVTQEDLDKFDAKGVHYSTLIVPGLINGVIEDARTNGAKMLKILMNFAENKTFDDIYTIPPKGEAQEQAFRTALANIEWCREPMHKKYPCVALNESHTFDITPLIGVTGHTYVKHNYEEYDANHTSL